MTDLSPSAYQPNVSLWGKIQRRLTKWQTASAISHTPMKPIVSFTFDDFPKSAAHTGAKLLEDVGARGTFYACSGLMDQVNATGQLYSQEDLLSLQARGHEIGAHTHTHLDCARSNTPDALSDIEENLAQLTALGVTSKIKQFAYPYGETRPHLKGALKDRFQTARGVLSGLNKKGSDLMQLSAFELDNNPLNSRRAHAAIKSAGQSPAWVVIFTHDVSEAPSPFGTTPGTLKSLIDAAIEIEADILTIGEAYKKISGS